MANFSHLQKLDVAGVTAELKLEYIKGSPVLVLAQAGQANVPYFNAVARMTSKQFRGTRGARVDASILNQQREQDRELFPRYVMRGWSGVVDADGNEVLFSQDNAADFLQALPDWLVDEIRNFASEPANFLEDDMDAEELAKN